MTNKQVISRLENIKKLLDDRENDIDSDSLSLSPSLETQIPSTQLKHSKKKRSKSTKTKNPPSKKHRDEDDRTEKTTLRSKRSSKLPSNSSSKRISSNIANYYNQNYDDSFSDNEFDSKNTYNIYTHDSYHKKRIPKTDKYTQDKYDFNENKRGQSIKYFKENPYSSNNDSEKTRSRISSQSRGYYYKAHDTNTGKDKYKKSSDKYYYAHKSKEEPQKSGMRGIYVTNSFKTSKSPQPSTSIYDQVYGYDGILNQNKRKNKKRSLFDSSSDSFHFKSSSEDDLDRFMNRNVENVRRNMERINLSSSSSDNLDIEKITRKYRKPASKETKKNSILDILNKKDSSWSLDDEESDFALTKPTTTKYKSTTTTSTINKNFTNTNKPYLHNFSNSSSSDDLNDVFKPYSNHLELASKRYQPTQIEKPSFAKKRYITSSSDDNDKNIASWKRRLDSINLSDDDDDDDSYNLKIPDNYLFNKTRSSKDYRFSGKTVSPILTKSTNTKFAFNSDEDSDTDLYNYEKYTLNKNAKLNEPVFSSSSDDDISLYPYLRRTKLYDDNEIIKNRAALRNVFTDFSDSSSSSSINIDDIIIKNELSKRTQKILEDDDNSDLELYSKLHQKPKSSLKSNLSISKPLFQQSPDINETKKVHINKKGPFDDDDDDLLMGIKSLKGSDYNSTKNRKSDINSAKRNLQFSSSDSIDDLYNQYSALTDQDIQTKAKHNYQNLNDDITDKSSTDDLIKNYSKLMPNTTGKRVEISKNEESRKKPSYDIDEDEDIADNIIQQIRNSHLLSSDDSELEKILKKNNNITKTEIISDSDNELPETTITRPSALKTNTSNKVNKEELKDDDDNLTDILIERYKHNKENDSKLGKDKNSNQDVLYGQTIFEEEEERENLDSTYDIIEDHKSMEQKIFKAFGEDKDDELLSDNIQPDYELDTKIAEINKRIQQLSDDDESSKNNYELPKQGRYISSSTANAEEENDNELQKENSANNVFKFLSPKEGQDNIRIGRSPSNDIRVEDDIQYEDNHEKDQLKDSTSNNKPYSSLLFNFNSSSNSLPQNKQEEEEEFNEVDDQKGGKEETTQPESPSKKKILQNINPLIIPTNQKSDIDNFSDLKLENQSGSGIATPIKSPDDKIPGTFNSDNSSDGVFGLTQPSPKSLTPSPFNSDAEILDTENKQGQFTPKKQSPGLNSSPDKKNTPPIPRPKDDVNNTIPDDDDMNAKLSKILNSISDSDQQDQLFSDEEENLNENLPQIKTSIENIKQKIEFEEEEDEYLTDKYLSDQVNQILDQNKQIIDNKENNQKNEEDEKIEDKLLQDNEEDDDEDEIQITNDFEVNNNQQQNEDQLEIIIEEEEEETIENQKTKNNLKSDSNSLVDHEEEIKTNDEKESDKVIDDLIQIIDDEEEEDDNEDEFQITNDFQSQDNQQQEEEEIVVDPDFLVDQEEVQPEKDNQEKVEIQNNVENDPNFLIYQVENEPEKDNQEKVEIQNDIDNDPNFLIYQVENEEEEDKVEIQNDVETDPNFLIYQVENEEEEKIENDPNFLVDQEEKFEVQDKVENDPDFLVDQKEVQPEKEKQEIQNDVETDPNFLIYQVDNKEEEKTEIQNKVENETNSLIDQEDDEEEKTEIQNKVENEINILIDQEEDEEEKTEIQNKVEVEQDIKPETPVNKSDDLIQDDEEEEFQITNDFEVNPEMLFDEEDEEEIHSEQQEKSTKTSNVEPVQNQRQIDNQSSGFEVDMEISTQENGDEEEDSQIIHQIIIDDDEEEENKIEQKQEQKIDDSLFSEEEDNLEEIIIDDFDDKEEPVVVKNKDVSLGSQNEEENKEAENKIDQKQEQKIDDSLFSEEEDNLEEIIIDDFEDKEEPVVVKNKDVSLGSQNEEEENLEEFIIDDFDDDKEEPVVVKNRDISFGSQNDEEDKNNNNNNKPNIVVKPKIFVNIDDDVENLVKQKDIDESFNEEESDMELHDNYSRLNEIHVEPRQFVQIEDINDSKNDENGKNNDDDTENLVKQKDISESFNEEESDMELHDNYSRLNEIHVEPRQFVQIEDINDSKNDENGNDVDDDELFSDFEEDIDDFKDVLEKGKKLLGLGSNSGLDDEDGDEN